MKYLSLEVPLGDVSILYNILTKEYSPRNHSMEGGRGEVRGGGDFSQIGTIPGAILN